MKMHPSITEAVLMDAAERRDSALDNPGFCVACGEEREGCEPDARRYPCDSCGRPDTVYGAEELLVMIVGW